MKGYKASNYSPCRGPQAFYPFSFGKRPKRLVSVGENRLFQQFLCLEKKSNE